MEGSFSNDRDVLSDMLGEMGCLTHSAYRIPRSARYHVILRA